MDDISPLRQVNDVRAVPISFQFNWEEDITRMGFTAENLDRVVPEAVKHEEGVPVGINYAELVPVLWSAVRELTARLEAVEKA